MPIENLKNSIDFTIAEKKLISSFDIPADAFIPLLFSLRDGGDWSYSAENKDDSSDRQDYCLR